MWCESHLWLLFRPSVNMMRNWHPQCIQQKHLYTRNLTVIKYNFNCHNFHGLCQGVQTTMLCPAECLCQESWEAIYSLTQHENRFFSLAFFVLDSLIAHTVFPISPLSKRQAADKLIWTPAVCEMGSPRIKTHFKMAHSKYPWMFKSRLPTSLFLNVHLHTPVFKDIVAYLS